MANLSWGFWNKNNTKQFYLQYFFVRVKWDVLFWFTFTKLDTFVQYLIIVQYFFYAILLHKKILLHYLYSISKYPWPSWHFRHYWPCWQYWHWLMAMLKLSTMSDSVKVCLNLFIFTLDIGAIWNNVWSNPENVNYLIKKLLISQSPRWVYDIRCTHGLNENWWWFGEIFGERGVIRKFQIAWRPDCDLLGLTIKRK